MNSEKDLDFDTYGEGSREFCPSKTSNFLRVYKYIYIYIWRAKIAVGVY